MSFELRARISADNTPLIAGLDQAKRHVHTFRTQLGSMATNELLSMKNAMVGAFGFAAISSGIRNLSEYIGEVYGLAKQWSITTTEAQEFLYVAEQAHTSVEKIMRGMGRERSESLLDKEQIAELRKEFQDLGLAIDENVIEKWDKVGDFFDQLGLRMKKGFSEGTMSLSENLIGIQVNAARLVSTFGALMENMGSRDYSEDKESTLLAMLGLGEDVDYQKALLQLEGMEKKLKEKRKARLNDWQGPLLPPGWEAEKDILHDARALASPRQAINRQFDSLARIGGFMQQGEQQALAIAQQQLQKLTVIADLLAGKGLGADAQNYL